MQLPAYWWLLALSIVIQGAFFLRFLGIRMQGKGVQPLSRLAACLVYASSVAGLAYGVVQRDPLFFLGQCCLLIIYFRMQKSGYDG